MARRRQVCTGQPEDLDAEAGLCWAKLGQAGPCWALLEPSFSRLSLTFLPFRTWTPLMLAYVQSSACALLKRRCASTTASTRNVETLAPPAPD